MIVYMIKSNIILSFTQEGQTSKTISADEVIGQNRTRISDTIRQDRIQQNTIRIEQGSRIGQDSIGQATGISDNIGLDRIGYNTIGQDTIRQDRIQYDRIGQARAGIQNTIEYDKIRQDRIGQGSSIRQDRIRQKRIEENRIGQRSTSRRRIQDTGDRRKKGRIGDQIGDQRRQRKKGTERKNSWDYMFNPSIYISVYRYNLYIDIEKYLFIYLSLPN